MFPFLAPLCIAKIFRLALIPRVDVPCQAQPPNANQYIYHPGAIIATTVIKSKPGEPYKTQAPCNISNIVALFNHGNRIPHYHPREECDGQPEIGIQAIHLSAIKKVMTLTLAASTVPQIISTHTTVMGQSLSVARFVRSYVA